MVKLTKLELRLLISWVLALIIFSSSLMLTSNAFPLDCQYKKLNKNSLISNCNWLTEAGTSMVFADFGTQFQLEIGEVASINSGEVELEFLEVVEDSRCPSDLDCFSAGQIQISIRISVDSQDLGTLNLINDASRSDLATQQFADYTIEFVKAEPYPQSNQELEASDYAVTLIVSSTEASRKCVGIYC